MKTALRSLYCALALALPGVALAQTEASVQERPLITAPTAQVPQFEVGRQYHIRSAEGKKYTGVLISISPTALQLDTKKRGIISISPNHVGSVEPLASVQAVPLRADSIIEIGNGHRIFFEPTARGLRKGENFLQITTIGFLGAYIGGDVVITNNISVSGSALVSPLLGGGIPFQLAPKYSFPISEKFQLGIVARYSANISSISGEGSARSGALNGLVTYGSADNNVTASVGLSYFGAGIWSFPTLRVGGQMRVIRRLSLFSENVLRSPKSAGPNGFEGLYGAKLNLRNVRIGLAYGYSYTAAFETSYTTYPPPGSPVINTFRYPARWNASFLPVHAELSFRLAKAN